MRDVLSDRTIRRLTLANSASNLSSGVFLGALPLAVASRGGGPFTVGAVAASMTGWWLLSIPLGAVIDRFGAGPTLRVVGLVRILSVFVIAAHAVVPDEWAIPVIFIGAAIFGLTDVLVDSATAAMPALLVDEDDYDNAYSLFYTVNRVTNMIAGPAIGAGLLAISTGLPFVVSIVALAISYGAYAAFFTDKRVGSLTEEAGSSSGGFSTIFAGLRHVFTDPFLRAVVTTLAGVVIAEEAIATVVAPYFRDAQGDHWAQLLGLLRSTAGVAALIASLFAGLLATRFGRSRVLGTVAAAAAAAPLIMSIAPAAAPVLIALVIAGAAEAIWVPLVQSQIARRTPGHLMGRTRAAIMFVTWGSMPVSALVAGGAAEAFGVRPVLWAAASVALLGCIFGVWRAFRRGGQDQEAPSDVTSTPASS